MPRFTANWYVLQEISFLLALHAGQYEKAKGIYLNVDRTGSLKKMDEPSRERWKLFNIYLRILGYFYEEKQQLKVVRVLNDLALYSTDKRGMNFPILIARLICLLTSNQDDQLTEFDEQFRQYVKRYVNRKKHYRTWYFARLTGLLFRYHFDTDKCRSIGRKFHQRLVDFSRKATRDYEMIEIVPYEHLWPLILDHIDRRFVARRKAS